MAKDPRVQQRTDAERIPPTGTGKLDATRREPARPGGAAESVPARVDVDAVRERLLRERQAAIDTLGRLGMTATDDEASGTGESPFEEGDVAQASERLDMSFAQRERLAERVNRLTRALERLARGHYGVCESCGGAIDAARLDALPEASVCRACQERLERGDAAA